MILKKKKNKSTRTGSSKDRYGEKCVNKKRWTAPWEVKHSSEEI